MALFDPHNILNIQLSFELELWSKFNKLLWVYSTFGQYDL